jgi:DtxR family Mn-dependent transcriptional regulator
MLPSSTVENYLKAIYVGETHLVGDQKLVPMGQLAVALGIAPGTATTMVKLAARVLRRHRLIELFLVQVMGMNWDEVHEDAEQMEHVVSDRLIERIDEMLGSPEFDPHGDPIPTADGQLAHRALESLLTCPLNTPVTVARVTDQDAAFLRFLESHHLKPGETIQVEARDEVSDSVKLKGRNDQRMTIGARAASKLLVAT